MYYYTRIRANIISSFGGFYMKNPENRKQVRNEILVFRQKGLVFNVEPGKKLLGCIKEALQPEFIAEWVYSLYQFYTVEDLVRYPAAIVLPYSVMSYRFTELYALAIPIFVPSPEFFLQYYDSGTKMFGLGWDRTSTKRPMCNSDYKLEEKMRPSVDRL